MRDNIFFGLASQRLDQESGIFFDHLVREGFDLVEVYPALSLQLSGNKK